MATNPKYFKLTGDCAIRKRGDAVYRKLGNIAEMSITLTQEKIKLTSKGNRSGTLASDILSSDATAKITLNAQDMENVALALKGAIATIAATTATAFTLPAMKAGEIYKLPHAKVSNVAIGSLLAATDYKVTGYSGHIEALATLTSTAGTYDSAEYTACGLYTGEDDEFQFLFWSDASKRAYEILRVKLSPGQHDLISNDYGEISLECELLVDEDVETGDLPADIKALGGLLRLSNGA